VHTPKIFSSVEMKVSFVIKKCAQKSGNGIQTHNSLNEKPVFYPKTNMSPLSYIYFHIPSLLCSHASHLSALWTGHFRLCVLIWQMVMRVLQKNAAFHGSREVV
jgi:hypothetical protein